MHKYPLSYRCRNFLLPLFHCFLYSTNLFISLLRLLFTDQFETRKETLIGLILLALNTKYPPTKCTHYQGPGVGILVPTTSRSLLWLLLDSYFFRFFNLAPFPENYPRSGTSQEEDGGEVFSTLDCCRILRPTSPRPFFRRFRLCC